MRMATNSKQHKATETKEHITNKTNKGNKQRITSNANKMKNRTNNNSNKLQ